MKFAEVTSDMFMTAYDMLDIFEYVMADFIVSIMRCNKKVEKACDDVKDLLLQCTTMSEAWLKCSVMFPDVKRQWIFDFMTWRLDELKIIIDEKSFFPPLHLHNVNIDSFKNQCLCRANRALFMHFAKIEVTSQLKSLANLIPNAFQKMRFKAC